MDDSAENYDWKVIRDLLLAAFTAEELRRFCQDRPTFRPVTKRFGSGQGLDDMVDEVMTYCDTYRYFPELLDEVRQANPRQYDRFEAQILPASSPAGAPEPDLRAAMKEIRRHLQDTGTAFRAQFRRREALVNAIERRLGIRTYLEYEKFFFRYHGEMNPEERFEFNQIRAITDGPMYGGNRAILEILDRNPALLEEVPELGALRTHLVFWLNKYEKVFTKTPEMCLCYAGVEDGVRFPPGVDQAIDDWLDRTAPTPEGSEG
jgi:hypothetical protein